MDKIITKEHVEKDELVNALEDYIADHPNPRTPHALTEVRSFAMERTTSSKITTILSSDRFNFIMGIVSGLCFLMLVFEEEDNMKRNHPWIAFACLLNSLLLIENLIRLKFQGNCPMPSFQFRL